VVLGYLATQMQRMQGELGRATARVVHLERTAATLEQELKETHFKRNVLQGQLDSASSKIEQLRETVQAAEAAHENWQTRFESMRGELESAKKLAEQARAEAEESTKHTASLQTKLDKANASRDSLQSELELAHSSVQQLRGEREKAQSELDDTRSRLTSKQDELEDARKKLKLGALRKDSGHPSESVKHKKGSLDPKLPLTERTELSADPAAEERDYLIRTLVFEASGETEIGMAAVAHVILNRKKSGKWGDKIRDVVTYPQQFEPWMTRQDDIEQLSPNDPRYLKAAVIANGVLAGLISDPTAGATHFLNPIVVRQRRGGSLPSWADAVGQPFGRHVFYSPERNRTVPQHAAWQGHPFGFAGTG
jgi:spore germination cell wall hydrolase CwlJ-like protein/FtsZ-binding cell division protein ZapB